MDAVLVTVANTDSFIARATHSEVISHWRCDQTGVRCPRSQLLSRQNSVQRIWGRWITLRRPAATYGAVLKMSLDMLSYVSNRAPLNFMSETWNRLVAWNKISNKSFKNINGVQTCPKLVEFTIQTLVLQCISPSPHNCVQCFFLLAQIGPSRTTFKHVPVLYQ